MTRRPVTRASRRSVLGGVVVGLTATGCEVASRREEPDASASGAEATEPSSTDDPDAQLVGRVVDELAAALALVSGVARARRTLSAEAAPWRRLHAAHLEALEAPERVRPVRVTGSAADLRTRLRRQEAALQRRLAEAAVTARSGALASLLATMSAAVAQQLAADSTGGDR